MSTHVFWPQMGDALAHEILSCAQATNKKLYRTALDILAPRFGMRAARVLELPKAERHRTMAAALGTAGLEALSFNLVSHWLVETQTPMLVAWLDALGVEHNGRGCADVFPEPPTAAKLKAGLDALLGQFDPWRVRLYLSAFNEIEDTGWPALDEALANDPRLQGLTGPKSAELAATPTA